MQEIDYLMHISNAYKMCYFFLTFPKRCDSIQKELHQEVKMLLPFKFRYYKRVKIEHNRIQSRNKGGISWNTCKDGKEARMGNKFFD